MRGSETMERGRVDGPVDGRVSGGTLGPMTGMGSVLAVCLFLLIPSSASAQGSEAPTAGAAQTPPAQQLSLSLSEALNLALDRSRDVQVARAGLEEAQEQVSEAWAAVYPSVDFSAGYTRNVSPAVSFLPAEIFDPTAEEGTFVPIQFGADNSWQSNVTLEQPLFQAGAFIGVSAAGQYEELQQEVLRGSVQETITRVRTLYFDLLLAQEEARLTRNSLDRVRASLDETRALNEAGLASDYDVLRLEVEVANLEPTLRTAENAVARNTRALALELSLQEPYELTVEGSLAELDLEELDMNSAANREILELMGVESSELDDAQALVARTDRERSDILQAEATADLRQAELRASQVEYLPRISLIGNYSIQAQQNGSPDFFGSGMNRAYARTVGLQVSVPVFQGFQRDAAIDRRNAVLRQARIQADLARDRARNEVLGFLDDAEEARLRARGQALAVEQAQRGYDIAAAEYAEGLTSRLQLTDAEVALRESEFNYARAVYDYLVARANLDRATGDVPVAD